MIISRDYIRLEHDDYILNVQPHLDRNENKESVRLYAPDIQDSEGKILNSTKACIGWKIQYKYE